MGHVAEEDSVPLSRIIDVEGCVKMLFMQDNLGRGNAISVHSGEMLVQATLEG